MVLATTPALAGCGGEAPAGTVGELLPTASAAAQAPTTPAVGSSVASPSPTATPGRLKGGGTYVLDHDGVVANFQLPPDGKQEDVVGLRGFLRQAHADPLVLASVTVTNRSRAPFSVSGFTVTGTPAGTRMYPVSTFVTLAMTLPGMDARPDLQAAGTVVELTSPVTVPVGGEVTTLVATQHSLSEITGVSYTPAGQPAVALAPLWRLRYEAAKLARQQARAAAVLARREAADARRAAARRHSGG